MFLSRLSQSTLHDRLPDSPNRVIPSCSIPSLTERSKRCKKFWYVTVEEVQKAVNLAIAKFGHNEYVRLDVKVMIEDAYREARDGQKFQY